MELDELVKSVADACQVIDASAVAFKHFRPGVGPYGEPQLVRLIAQHLRDLPTCAGGVETKRTPDLLVKGLWAVEFKIARPFGDNGAEAENWSVNLLHPYPGNVSVIGDCIKLANLVGPERRATLVIGYEHSPPWISLDPLLAGFELIARSVASIKLGPRVEVLRHGLIHPVHQQLRVVGWQVIGGLL